MLSSRRCLHHPAYKPTPGAWLPCRHIAVHAQAATNPPPERAAHLQKQLDVFTRPDIIEEFSKPLPPELNQRLKLIVGSVPALNKHSRVIDVGTGTGCLIPHLQARGVKDILAVDLSKEMLAEVSAKYGQQGTLGNDPGVRVWQGDLLDLPGYMGPADALFMNAVFGNMLSPKAALVKASMMVRPGGHVIISHPMGRRWHSQLHNEQPGLVPHQLPDRPTLESMMHDLPLHVISFMDEKDLYCTVMRVPPNYWFRSAPMYLSGRVVPGFKRGSKQMGTPTANIDPAPLREKLKGLPKGVYFGWAKLDAPTDWPDDDHKVHKMVMNIGSRPTVNMNHDVTIECHILHNYKADFYGQNLRVVMLGYIRPEMRFSSIDELVSRIKGDIATAKSQLENTELQVFKSITLLGGPRKA